MDFIGNYFGIDGQQLARMMYEYKEEWPCGRWRAVLDSMIGGPADSWAR